MSATSRWNASCAHKQVSAVTVDSSAGLCQASEAVLRGFNVIVPVDGVSAENTYIEQYVAYNFTSAPIISAKVTLTRTDMVNF